MPSPPPIKRQRWRPSGAPCSSRGDHPRGTEIVRPSTRSTGALPPGRGGRRCSRRRGGGGQEAVKGRAQQGQGMPATSAGRSVAPSRPYGPTAGGLTPRAKGGHGVGQMRHRATISALTYTCPPGTTPAQTCQSYRPSSPGSAASASAGSNTPWPISSKTPGHPAHLAGAGAPSGA
jgi:hypothetical protein